MSDTKPTSGIVITQREVYEQVQAIDDKLDRLMGAVGEMVAINRRLDQHHERLNAHGERLRVVEAKVMAHAVIIGLITAAIAGMVVKVFTEVY